MLKAEDVAEFLKQNPGFFSEHQEVLADLEVGGDQLPFHQRQLEVLRDRHNAEQARYELVVDSARKNQDLEQQLHKFAQALLVHSSHSEEAVCETLCQHFDLPGAVLKLTDRQNGEEDAAAEDFALLARRVAHGNSICDDRVPSRLVEWLFGTDSGISSCAFVPLSGEQSGQKDLGVMVLGAREQDRFQPGMGTIYLDRIGQLVTAYLRGRG